MITIGSIIVCRDGKRFLVEEAPNEEWVLMDLDNFKIRYMNDDVIISYVNAYHMGVLTIAKAKILCV